MKSTLCRTYFKFIRRDLDSTFALGLSVSLVISSVNIVFIIIIIIIIIIMNTRLLFFLQ